MGERRSPGGRLLYYGQDVRPRGGALSRASRTGGPRCVRKTHQSARSGDASRRRPFAGRRVQDGAAMHIDLTSLPYVSRRQPLFARRGVVATSQAPAAQAGLAALQRGGNAVDAAIATAAALTVLEPGSCGVGGDAFALVWDGAKLHGLNGSGRAPAALSADAVRRRGHESMPERGWLSVTVPGAPAAWRDLHARFGR